MKGQSAERGVRVAGVLLAAGESRRMGETNKLLLPVDGHVLLARSVALLAQSELSPQMVVLGHRLEDSAPVVSQEGVAFVINAQYSDGQQSSVRAGLRAVAHDADAVLVMLADLPRLQASTLSALHAAVQSAPEADAWVPAYKHTWGNPRVIGRPWCRALLADPALTTRALFERHPERVVVVPVDDAGILQDLDTPDDYRAYLDQTVS
ncbi:MAG: nucleotidyltransferase family protein [Pseudomonadota bacterium]